MGEGVFSWYFLMGDRERFILFITHDHANMPVEHETIQLRFTL
jgi:hypothetical protein